MTRRIYNINIWESPNWSGKAQRFDATCRETGHHIERSSDPEHDLARILSAALAQDGQMLAWRGNVPAMKFASVRRAARQSMRWNGHNSWERRKFESMPTDLVREAA